MNMGHDKRRGGDINEMKCECRNPYELPERDDSQPGFADIYSFYCEKCGEFLGNVRIDIESPHGQGFGWTLDGKQPEMGELAGANTLPGTFRDKND